MWRVRIQFRSQIYGTYCLTPITNDFRLGRQIQLCRDTTTYWGYVVGICSRYWGIEPKQVVHRIAPTRNYNANIHLGCQLLDMLLWRKLCIRTLT